MMLSITDEGRRGGTGYGKKRADIGRKSMEQREYFSERRRKQ
jgi:hypothetical protein